MRVIAGIHKGRVLKSAAGESTRPTSDKVKEAVFQVMGPYFSGGLALDLFAGSGSLGIEALSRDMSKVIFVDKHPKAVQIIKENLKSLQLEAQAEVYRNDAERALKAIAKRELQFDLVLLDPPYKSKDYMKLLDYLLDSKMLNKNAIVYCEHDKTNMLPDTYKSLKAIKQADYGGLVQVTIYQSDKREEA
ncbi:methyltransferase [Oceanobacillus oncorhynchi subsp. incaldanensis]|uniref:Ribosomal RNA small subunit methyltransferase D n=2 Tax=Oceanobacillus TaxID=182709 RepID=A0A0A1MY13_9BACI|nr:16S rRNA (guanine(966)-N(2))-methyltransferase RsmD [Oceanobacillus oncorhynchi]MDM8100830.1 16S rRNA (guanine(966)-N(2))-methyltransferase RsmD [Oceanobacillus oncorhynchi]UUI38708.1 16S rRNA (guanine(966)-N(2))-methyltransferase RsmD [Oceanobacillus oncorhynchi]GIO18269.1 methyltransferase [Oceanobacillus oncorhynchi subsp. incaldanensis]CEI84409.1 Ribosomal RNA small subunit methyltransferase D [Oceanobacillus oncorhynchi]